MQQNCYQQKCFRLLISLLAAGWFFFGGPQIQQAEAAIDWSACRTEGGTTTIAASSNSSNVTLNTAITDTSKAFLLVDSSGSSGVVAGDGHMVSGYIANTTTLTFQRDASPATDAQVFYSLVECFNNEFSVQRGEITIAASATSNTATITSVDTTTSIVIVSSRTADTNWAEDEALVTGELQDATTVLVERAVAGTYATYVRYEVVTFSTESSVSIQTGEVTLASGNASVTDTITSVTTSRSWVYCSWDASDIGLKQSAIGCELTNSTTATFYRHTVEAYTNRIRYYVVEFPSESGVSVQRGSVFNDPGSLDDTQYNHDITITAVNSITKAFPFVTNTTDGAGTAFPRNKWIESLLDTTTLRTSFWRGADTGAADDNYKYWQVVEFPAPAWYGECNWGYRKKITIDSTKVPNTDQSNFPVLINTTDLDWRDTANGGNVGQSDGGDILFTSSDGTTKLSHEIERYTPSTGELIAWVNVPTVSASTDTDIYIYYGNATAADQWETDGSTWNSNYGIVYHMDTSGTDSTANNRNRIADVGVPTADNTYMGYGLSFDGDDAWDQTDLSYWEQAWSIRSHEVVFKTGSDVTTRQTLFAEGGGTNGIMLYILSGNLYARWWSEDNSWSGGYQSTGISTNTTYHVIISYEYSGGNYELFVNGSSVGSTGTTVTIALHAGEGGIAYTGSTGKDFHDGYLQGAYFIGSIYEFRVRDVATDSNYATTTYNNQSSPSTFYTLSSEETRFTWVKGDWLYRKKITIDNTKVSNTDQTNFPVLINTTDTDWRDTANGGNVAQSDGGDILFTSCNETTKLSHEIERYTPSTGELIAWVKVPTVSASTDTDLYMYYGNADAADQWDINGTWDSNFKMVQHLQEAPANGVAGHIDSTSNSNTGTPYNFDGTSSSTTDGTGQINGADVFDGTDTYISVNDNASLDFGTTDSFTITFWMKILNNTSIEWIIDKIDRSVTNWQGYHSTLNTDGTVYWMPHDTTQPGGNWPCGILTSTTVVDDGNWHMITGVRDVGADECYIYVDDGVAEDTNSDSTTTTLANAMGFYMGDRQDGDRYYSGTLDEVRVSNAARSADWINTAYNNQSSPSTFYTVGSEATVVDLVGFDAIGLDKEVLLKWKTASEIDNAGFNLYRSTSRNGKYEKLNSSLIPGLGSSVVGREYEYVDSSVINGTTYYYKLEDVEFDGTSTMHGPVEAHPGLDSDGDGMTDDWENYYGLDPYDPADAYLDPDRDGKTNLEEFLSNTDPFKDEGSEEEDYSNEPLRIIESNNYHVVMELVTKSFETEEKIENGESYQLITIPDYIHGYTTEQGIPQLPAKGVLIGVPQGASVKLNILDYDVEVMDGYYNIYPVPEVNPVKKSGPDSLSNGVKDSRRPEDTPLTSDLKQHSKREVSIVEEKFNKDEDIYSKDAFYPEEIAEVFYTGDLRGQRVARVVFYPFQFNPVKGSLRFYKKIKVEILFDKGKKPPGGEPGQEPLPTTENPVLKISLKEQGMYKVGYDDLYNAGLSNLSYLDPRTIKIYNSGKEIPIKVKGEEDGRFDLEDEIIFYGEALNTKYSSTNVYWLFFGEESGLRMQEHLGSIEEPIEAPDKFPFYFHWEKDEYYWPELEGNEDVDRWFFYSFVWGGAQRDFTLKTTGLSNDPSLRAKVRLTMRGFFDISPYPDHHALIFLNDNLIADTLWKSKAEHIVETEVPQHYLLEGDNTITIRSLLDTGAEYDLILANWFEIDFLKNLTAEDNILKFGYEGDGTYLFEISGFSSNEVEIFDISNPQEMKYITNFQFNGNTVSFMDALSGWKEYVVIAREKMKKPEIIEIDEPSHLRTPENQADYLIITAEDFYQEVLPLANLRERKGLSTKIVKIKDIYDEFNSGIQSPYAVKDFLKYTYYNWQRPAPTYVLLVGDASYDYKDNLGFGRSNYVPTYLLWTPFMGETGSDNWFVLLDGEDDRLADMFIGRIPVRTSEEVRVVVNKTIMYELTPKERANRVIFVADDDISIFEDSSDELADLLPGKFEAIKLYLNSYDNPQSLTQDLINQVNQGALILNYVGHGGVELWASEEILNIQDIGLFNNENRLPLVVSMTCLDGYYLHPFTYNSMAETFLKKAGGGAIASWSPTGMGLPTGHAILNKGLFKAVFNDYNSILGSAINQAKLSLFLQSGNAYNDLLQTYTLFGDPALKLKIKQRLKRKGEKTEKHLHPGFEGILQSIIANHGSSRYWRDKDKRGARE